MDQVESTAELIEVVNAATTVRVVGGGSKPALSRDANLGVKRLRGVVEYQPSEFTMTVRAGTPLADIEKLLAEKQQYLPCDLPLAEAGATIGGAVAAGVSGPGRFRYGGLRDFLLGVELVTGDGQLVRLGSRVVKNAAGFDFPKLMVGSLGRFGVLTELTVKVFPQPAASRTVVFEVDNRQEAVQLMLRLGAAPLDLARLDVVAGREVWAQVGGNSDAVAARAERLQQMVAAASRQLSGEEETGAWDAAKQFAWAPADHGVVKIAVTPSELLDLADALDPLPMRISVGGHLLWVAWPEERLTGDLDQLLRQRGLGGLALTGVWPQPLLGRRPNAEFAGRLATALDPAHKFPTPAN